MLEDEMAVILSYLYVHLNMMILESRTPVPWNSELVLEQFVSVYKLPTGGTGIHQGRG